MSTLRWLSAALLLVALIIGVGMVFQFFLARGDPLVLVIGLALVGVSGAALRDVHPSKESVAYGDLYAFGALILYGIGAVLLVAGASLAVVAVVWVAVIVAIRLRGRA